MFVCLPFSSYNRAKKAGEKGGGGGWGGDILIVSCQLQEILKMGIIHMQKEEEGRR
jgi:GTPase involved in cell partitioning and DNA repair